MGVMHCQAREHHGWPEAPKTRETRKEPSEQTFLQRRYKDGQQAHEKMLNITNHQGNANQNHNEISPHICQNDCHQKDNKYQVLVRMWRKGNPPALLEGM